MWLVFAFSYHWTAECIFSILLLNVFCTVGMRNICFHNLNLWGGHQQALGAWQEPAVSIGVCSWAKQSSSTSVYLKNNYSKKESSPVTDLTVRARLVSGWCSWQPYSPPYLVAKGTGIFLHPLPPGQPWRLSIPIQRGLVSSGEAARVAPSTPCRQGVWADPVWAADGHGSGPSPQVRVQPAASKAGEWPGCRSVLWLEGSGMSGCWW